MSSLRLPGPWHEAGSTLLTARQLGEFAGAVGETCPALLDGSEMAPTFPVVLGWNVQNHVLDGVLPKEALGLHGEQEFHFLRPMKAGAEVRNRVRLESIVPRRSGTTVSTVTECYDRDGVFCSQLFTIFAVGQFLPAAGTPADRSASARLDDSPVVGRTTEQLAVEQPARYAEASGDGYKIHLDDDFAKARGLPGVIAHGMSTMAFAARAVRDNVRASGWGDLSHLYARFSAPVRPGDLIETVVRGEVAATDELVGSFVSTVVDGPPVITAGRFSCSRA